MILVMFVLTGTPVYAIPSFTRQTGQDCTSCHVGAFGPQLTPFGRQFKLNGYVWGEAETKIPPLNVIGQGSFTRTKKDQLDAAAPRFSENDNFALDRLALLYGGRVFGNLGAWAQLNYDGVDDRLSLDHTDIRYADSASLGDMNFVYGLTLNNNPTIQDAWNSTPAWMFPYARSKLAPMPAAMPLIDEGLALQSAGLGAYTLWNDLLYVELSGYRSLSQQTQTRLGIASEEKNKIDGIAPYWRLALQNDWGGHYTSIGTYGLYARIFPDRNETAGTDRYRDLGFDATYQFLANPRHVVSLYATYLHERQSLDASVAEGHAANSSNTLRTFRANASYYFDQTYGLTIGYFDTRGTTDTGRYEPEEIMGSANGSPDSRGLVAQIDFTPFGKQDSFAYPWVNLRLALQYVAYFKFNGARSDYDGFGRDASDNNTLFLLAWLAF